MLDPRRTRGQSVTEFALILPVLILSLLIVLDFGRLFFSYVTLNNATRIAANFGATSPASFTGTLDTTTYDAAILRETSGLNCTIRPVNGHNPPIPTYPGGSVLGSMSIATMTCDFRLITPIIGAVFGGGVTLSASSQFPVRTGAISNIGGTTTLPPPGSPVAAFSFVGVSGGTVDGSGNVTGTDPVSINASDGSSNAQTWDWNWGDGSAHDFGPTPAAHSYSQGSFTVTLTVTNTVGTSTATRTITVNPVVAQPPVAGFFGTPVANAPGFVAGGTSSGVPITGTLPLVVNFTNISTNGTAYSWSFGDGTPGSTAVSPQHQFSTLGVFIVTLTVTAPNGGTPFTRTNYVTTGCQVPNFANTSTSTAAASWANSNFTGTITYQPTGAPGSSGASTSPPVPAENIQSQTGATGGDFVPATRQNNNSPWVCAPDIKLRYAP